MSKSKSLIPGHALLAKLGIDQVELSYLIIKHRIKVFNESPRKSLLRCFLRSRHVESDREEILEIIQNDPEKLRYKLFLIQEVEKVPLRIVKPKDSLEDACILEERYPEAALGKPEVGATQPHNRVLSRPSIKLVDKSCSGIPIEDHEFDSYVGIEGYFQRKHRALLKHTIEDHESAIKNSPNVFSRLGEVWFVKFRNKEWGLYPDQEKYRYIAHLLDLCDACLKNHGHEYSIYNTDLIAKVKGEPTGAASDDTGGAVLKELTETDLNESDLSDKLSVEDIRKFREMGLHLLERFENARKSGNQDEVEQTQEKIDKYCSHLSGDYGIKAVISEDGQRITLHQFYRPAEEFEKRRQAVKNQINNAIRKFERMPKFQAHLQHSLKTGYHKTVYSPEN